MGPKQVLETLGAISDEAHALSRPSGTPKPGKPVERTPVERLAALVERLSDVVRTTLVPEMPSGPEGRPTLHKADEP